MITLSPKGANVCGHVNACGEHEFKLGRDHVTKFEYPAISFQWFISFTYEYKIKINEKVVSCTDTSFNSLSEGTDIFHLLKKVWRNFFAAQILQLLRQVLTLIQSFSNLSVLYRLWGGLRKMKILQQKLKLKIQMPGNAEY